MHASKDGKQVRLFCYLRSKVRDKTTGSAYKQVYWVPFFQFVSSMIESLDVCYCTDCSKKELSGHCSGGMYIVMMVSGIIIFVAIINTYYE